MNPSLIYLEIPDADKSPLVSSHPLDFIWMPVVDTRPYRHNVPQLHYTLGQSHATYFRAQNLPPGLVCVRVDYGMTFGSVGHTEKSSTGADVLVGPSFEEALKGYSRGLLNYRKRTDIADVGTDGWIGSEFENLCAYIKGLEEYAKATFYFDALGENILDPAQRGHNSVIDQLLDSPAFPQLPSPTQTMIHTVDLATRAAGHTGRIILPHLSRYPLPIDWLGGTQPATKLPRRFYSHHWWTSSGQRTTSACAWACGFHEGKDERYYIHLSAHESTAEELSDRICFAPSSGGVIIFAAESRFLEKVAQIKL